MANLETNIDQKLPLLGWINYWNLLPLYKELKIKFPDLDLATGHPVEINKMLINGDLDYAPSSSICLAKEFKLSMAAPIGVSASGKVDSVYLGFSKEQLPLYQYFCARNTELANFLRSLMGDHEFSALELADLIFKGSKIASKIKAPVQHTFILSTASAASVGLTKLFYQLWLNSPIPLTEERFSAESCKATQSQQSSSLNSIELLIGDLALQKRAHYEYSLDLSEAWFELTALPFVFSVWQGKKTMPDEFKRQLLLAAEAAQNKMHHHPENYFPDKTPHDILGMEINLASYWQKIEYILTPRHLKGLELYVEMINRLI